MGSGVRVYSRPQTESDGLSRRGRPASITNGAVLVQRLDVERATCRRVRMPVGTSGEEFHVHVLTKLFMIVAAVLSIALSSLVIAYTVNTDRVLADYSNMRAERDAAQANLAAEQGRAGQSRAQLEVRIQQLQGDLNAQIDRVRQLEAERAELRTARDRAESARSSVEAKIAEIGETARTQAALITSYRDEVLGLRRSEMDFRRRSLEMEDRLSDLESQREVLEQNYRALQEELAEAKRVQQNLLAGGGAGGTVRAADQPFVFAGPIIQGRVEEVTRDPGTGAVLAKINVGTNNRVARNMTFYVIRNNNFQANLVVREADLNFAVGAITLGTDIAPGDIVVSRLQ